MKVAVPPAAKGEIAASDAPKASFREGTGLPKLTPLPHVRAGARKGAVTGVNAADATS
ncbi:hypothetical protein GCM10009754_77210 [Amycolatopsis minnesotensis]|uniref:Uncharacterized protein n=1 Tax=Amycolatopsis minnesotensis TaxID=337894 RepID=A0ABN2SJ99_9PSEU